MANEYRVSQFAIETLHDRVGSGRVSNYAIEVLSPGDPRGRVSLVAIEVLRTIPDAPAGRRRYVIGS